MGYRNRWTHTIWIAGVPYPPGTIIPASADPAQLAYVAAQGIVEPTTAPAPVLTQLRRVTQPTAVIEEEVPDGGTYDRPV